MLPAPARAGGLSEEVAVVARRHGPPDRTSRAEHGLLWRKCTTAILGVVFALVLGGCGGPLQDESAVGQSGGTGDDAAGTPSSSNGIVLGTRDCDDVSACPAGYLYDGRFYATEVGVDARDVEDAEIARFEVAVPAGLSWLVLTDDPDVVYLYNSQSEEWLRGHALPS